jgi:hypothetical protein
MQIQIGEHLIEFDYEVYLRYFWVGVLFVVACRVLGYFALKSLREDYSKRQNLERTTRALKWTGVAVSTCLWSVAATLLAVAAAEPFEPNQPIVVPAGTISYVMAFDVSPSAEAEDYRDSLPPPRLPDGSANQPIGPWGSRLQVARWLAFNKIMKAMPGNKKGIVAYTADARVVSLLRDDDQVINDLLNNDEALTAPGGGSDPSDALRAAIQILRKQYDESKQQMIFVFTDGGVSDLEEKTSQDDKDVWERDFQRTLKELAALKEQALRSGVKPPKVVLIGVGGDQEVMVPLYYTDGERVRNEKGEPDFFPFGAPADKKEKTKLVEANIVMLKDRIGAVVDCQYLRVSQNWQENEQLSWVKDVIGGQKSAVGKRYLTAYPLYAAMALILLLFARGLFRSSDAIARRRMLPSN